MKIEHIAMYVNDLEKTKDIVNSSKSRLFFAKVLFFPVSFLPFESIKNVNHIID